MGFTTEIYFEILDIFKGKDKNTQIEILEQNEPPNIKCQKCNNEALYFDQKNGDFICEDCGKKLGGDKMKIVNSPRTGVCEYQ